MKHLLHPPNTPTNRNKNRKSFIIHNFYFCKMPWWVWLLVVPLPSTSPLPCLFLLVYLCTQILAKSKQGEHTHNGSFHRLRCNSAVPLPTTTTTTTTAGRSQTGNNMLNHGVLQDAGPQTREGCLDYMRCVFMRNVNIRPCSRGALSHGWAGSQRRDLSGDLSTKGGGMTDAFLNIQCEALGTL